MGGEEDGAPDPYSGEVEERTEEFGTTDDACDGLGMDRMDSIEGSSSSSNISCSSRVGNSSQREDPILCRDIESDADKTVENDVGGVKHTSHKRHPLLPLLLPLSLLHPASSIPTDVREKRMGQDVVDLERGRRERPPRLVRGGGGCVLAPKVGGKHVFPRRVGRNHGIVGDRKVVVKHKPSVVSPHVYCQRKRSDQR